MKLHSLLKEQLEPLARRRQASRLWRELAVAWAVAALVSLAVLGLQRLVGWSSVISLPLSGLIGLGLGTWVWLGSRRKAPDWRAIALQLEAAHPELQGRLLTAIQQDTTTPGALDYLQRRVIEEALAHSRRNDWGAICPRSRVALAQALQLGALALFGWTLWQLRVPAGQGVFVATADLGVTVTPGDAELERGSSLVVAAQFKGALPPQVELVYGQAGATNGRLQLVRSLADPLFGGTVPEVGQDLVYHLEYAGRRTRDYKISIFDYPRLERSDAAVRYPEYTGLSPRQIQNTRRVSAVEGSRIDLHLQLNKMVAQASLVARGTNRQALRLAVDTNHPSAILDGFVLAASKTYQLELVDGAGRTNQLPAQFVFQALKNATPELKITSPRGDTRPSSLEELVFEGTVFDDFGVQAFGLASVVAGKEMKVIELGQKVPGKEKRSFQYVLRLEDLGLKPDDLMSWFVWADDIGPDGKMRRTSGDLYFAEVRPFEEVFREGPSMSAESQQEQQSGQGGSQAEKLADLQKQIISATWKLFRQSGQSLQPGAPKNKTGEEQKSSDESNRSSSRAPAKRTFGASSRPRSGQMRVAVDYQSTDRWGEMGPRRVATGASGYYHLAASGDGAGTAASPRSGAPALEWGRGRPHPYAVSDEMRSGVTPDSSGQVRPLLFAQRAPENTPSSPRTSARVARQSRPEKEPELTGDIDVVRSAQEQALEQAQEAGNRQNPRTAGLWEAAARQMERALEKLQSATNSPAQFQEALAAEQAAYQALLKLQEREYSVSRSRRSQRGQSGRQQQRQQQLDQLDMTQEENRYETERRARAPQNPERSEQLQVMNRLQELARRQQDLNERLKEMQTALQEARTEAEREAARRQLKRLQEEQQQLLADADEVRQRMDRPENQSRMNEQRQQMEQARNDLQRATEAAQQGQASQALAAGTRAQRQLQQMREEMRRQNASELETELRQMRTDARELARQQEAIQKKMEGLNGPQRLSDADLTRETLESLAAQRQRLTNLVDQATQLSRDAEESEPLVSRELYDTLRRFSQNETSTSKQFQEEFLNRSSRELYERLKRTTEQSGSKSLDLTSEMLRLGLQREANRAQESARAGIEDLKRGVERAAQGVLGDDAQSLRLAGEELDRLAEQLRKEMAQAEGGQTNSPQELAQAGNPSAGGRQPGERAEPGQENPESGSRGERNPADPNSGQARAGTERQQPGEGQSQSAQGATPGSQPAGSEGQKGQQGRQGQQTQRQGDAFQPGEAASQQQRTDSANNEANRGGQNPDRNPQRGANRPQSAQNSGGGGGNRPALDLDRLLEGRGDYSGGPITGEDFAPWSDRLREVEELVDTPSLRTEVARARERARQVRQDFKRNQKKPDWASVRLQVLNPLVEVRNEINEELARRNPQENLVPIDRDPVPGRYSELVRKYYERLGKEPAVTPRPNPEN